MPNLFRPCKTLEGVFLKSSVVRWVSPVGCEASTGGGVARAVDLFRKSNVVHSSVFLSLLGKNKWRQFGKALSDVYIIGYRRFIVHSIFTPYSLLILLLPFRGRVIILPHGELKSGALAISSRYKKTFMNLFRVLGFLSYHKHVYFIASNTEEIERAKSIFKLADNLLAPDLVDSSLPLPKSDNFIPEEGATLVTISRLVPNKAVASLMRELVIAAEANQLGWLSQVVLFVTEEDPLETTAVRSCSEKLKSCGKSVKIYVGLEKNQIGEVTSKLPNKICFLSSRFESFSYALLESLYFEYTPIVWFENELVQKLVSEGLCIQLEAGKVVTDSTLELIRRQDLPNAELFINSLSQESSKQYRNFLQKVIYNDI